MPKYFPFKIAGYYLYYTTHCTAEAMHAHASDEELSEATSAKFFICPDGSTRLMRQGSLTDRDVRTIQAFIKIHYLDMYRQWKLKSVNGFYIGG